jgi:acyl-ACP thioesterase
VRDNAAVPGPTGRPEAKRSPMAAFTARPAAGRVYSARRLVRSTDVTPAGRLRLDALARYLQAAAEDDLADAGWAEPCTWLVRRTALAIRGFPRLGQRLRLDTFCSGTGPRWAQRTTTVTGPDGDLIQSTAVWAAVDRAAGRPVALGPQFHRLYDGAAEGREASVRLSHPRPPEGIPAAPWPLRAADFDPAGHVNNAVHWAVVEDVLAGLDWLPRRAEVEYHRPVLPAAAPALAVSHAPGAVSLWLLDASGQRLASARLWRPDSAAAHDDRDRA